jgi:hypothetical protein
MNGMALAIRGAGMTSAGESRDLIWKVAHLSVEQVLENSIDTQRLISRALGFSLEEIERLFSEKEIEEMAGVVRARRAEVAARWAHIVLRTAGCERRED